MKKTISITLSALVVMSAGIQPLLGSDGPQSERSTDVCRNEEQIAKLAPKKSKIALSHYKALASCLENAQDARSGRLRAMAKNAQTGGGKTARPGKTISDIATELPVIESRLNEANAQVTKIRRHVEFAGFNVGLGLAGAYHLGDVRIKKAVLDGNRKVTVQETLEHDLRFVTTVRRFPWTSQHDNFGIGPFAVVNLGFEQTKVLSSLGAGIMLGVRARDKGAGLGIGIAYVIDTNVQTMRSDFVMGNEAPEGENEVRFVDKADDSVLLVVSYDF